MRTSVFLVFGTLALGAFANSLPRNASVFLDLACADFSAKDLADPYPVPDPPQLTPIPGLTADLSNIIIEGIKSIELKLGAVGPDNGNGDGKSALYFHAMSLNIDMDYRINGALGETKVAGEGKGNIKLGHLEVKGRANGPYVNGKLTQVATLEVVVDLHGLAIDLKGFKVNDTDVDWEKVNKEMENNFKELWKNNEKDNVEELRKFINDQLKGDGTGTFTSMLKKILPLAECSAEGIIGQVGTKFGDSAAYSSIASSFLVLLGVLLALTN